VDTLRRELLGHLLIFGDRHLNAVLAVTTEDHRSGRSGRLDSTCLPYTLTTCSSTS